MKIEKSIENFKIGLVLAGGGAKGAYEFGVYKALCELEIMNQVKVISGTSIGAINALFFSMDNLKEIGQTWRSLSYSKFILNEENIKNLTIKELISRFRTLNSENNLIAQIKSNEIGFISQDGIKNFIAENIDIDVIKKSGKELFACAYNIDKERAEYFRLNECTAQEIESRVLASCAVPYLYKPIIIDGDRYADGGIHSPAYSKNNIDNVPIIPLKEYDLDIIIVVHLSQKSKINSNKFNNVIEIHPSASLEIISGIGTVNINQNTINENINMGYRDAIVILAPIVIGILKGKSLDEILK